MPYNPIDEKFVDEELNKVLDVKSANRLFHKWKSRLKKGDLALGKKVEILLTYGNFDLVKNDMHNNNSTQA